MYAVKWLILKPVKQALVMYKTSCLSLQIPQRGSSFLAPSFLMAAKKLRLSLYYKYKR